MFYDILTRMASDTGLDAVQQRSTIARYINGAKKEIHQRLECNKMYREITFVVPANKVVSLPFYVGELRGVKQHDSELITKVTTMSVPRFTKSTKEYIVNKWTELGDSPVHTNLTSVGPLTFVSSNIDNVTIAINGETDSAQVLEEKLLLDATEVTSVNLFGPTINAIACFSERTGDIIVKDSDDNEIAILYNQQNKTRYKLIDVSQCGFSQNISDSSSTLMDVLYKFPYSDFKNDTDSFVSSDDYDDVLYHYSMYLYYLPMQGKENDAAASIKQAFTSLTSVKVDEESIIDKKLNFGRNRFYGLADRFVNNYNLNSSVADTWRTNYTY